MNISKKISINENISAPICKGDTIGTVTFSLNDETISSVNFESTTFLYGVIMKPYSFILAYDARDVIRPMFCPSGDSIGQIRP